MISLKEPSLLRTSALLAGAWVGADSGETLDVRNPSTGQLIATVPKMGAAEAERAIAAAHDAHAAWASRTAEDRANVLKRWFALMLEHQQDLALIMTVEQGKPLLESVGEIAYAASFIEWFAEEARRVYGLTIPSPWPARNIVVLREPVGVCAAITPWNFPAAMITRKVAPALAAGCTIIVKPASQTPLSALAMAELALRAGVPAGVFSVITGDSRLIGGALTASKIVRKLTFTGSTDVGRVLAGQCAPTLKKMSLELGGNAPFIVFDDADLDAAVEGAIQAKYRNTGQTCVCANRILVQAPVYDAFCEKFARAVGALRVGDGLEDGVAIGPMIDRDALEKVETLVSDAVAAGGKIVVGGQRHGRGGTFYQPTVIADASTQMRIAHEEVFGPVAPVFRFATEQEAIALANDTEFGLAAYFYARDAARVWRVSKALEYGMVGVNCGLISTAVAPFGGIKQSGMGREGGPSGIDEYLEMKYISMA